tara:strand:- start:2793 stop:4247 length:1455 start_codon:yes stop_codon:yes gene_type:complete
MNRVDRIKNIEKEIQIALRQEDETPLDRKRFLWKGKIVSRKAYQISLSNLIYNKYNTRIGSKVKTYEAHKHPGQKINPENPDHEKLLERFIEEKSPDRNNDTLTDINKNGQIQIAVVTKDGIIIDGNRRAMLIKKSQKDNYLLSVVLEEKYEDDPLAIMKLEASFQELEDEKVAYDPIEKYLRIKEYRQQHGLTLKEIVELENGLKERDIKFNLDVMEMMDAYLRDTGSQSAYTRLNNREDAFRDLTRWVNSFNNNSKTGFDGFNRRDISNLKSLCFDYIRSVYEKNPEHLNWKDLRVIANGQQQNHLFGSKDLWNGFNSEHRKNIDPVIKQMEQEQEESKIQDSPEIEKILNSQDQLFSNRSIAFLTNNFERYKQLLNNRKDDNKPNQLSEDILDKIKQLEKSKKDDTVIEDLNESFDLISDILQQKQSLLQKLDKIKNQLYSIPQDYGENLQKAKADKDELVNLIFDIKQTLFDLEKKAKRL